MADEPRAEFFVATEDLDNTGRKDLLSDFDQFEGGIWRERAVGVINTRARATLEGYSRGLHNDAVAGDNSRCNFPHRYIFSALFQRYEKQFSYIVLAGLEIMD